MEIDVNRQAFKEEACELLSELESSLLEWEAKPSDADLIGRIFRAMHTIKGSGSMFGCDDIASFTHEVETALDTVREGRLAVTKELINLTLVARDHIQSLVDAMDSGEIPNPEEHERLKDAFRRLANFEMGDGVQEKPKLEQIANIENLQGASKTYRIRFKPDQTIFLKGTRPIGLINELRELGHVEIFAYSDEIPRLEDFEAEFCYIYWDIILTTDRGLDAIKDVFIFVEDDCELKIELIDEESAYQAEALPPRLGEILVSRHDVSAEALEKAIEHRPLIGEVLVNEGLVSPDHVRTALAEQQRLRDAHEKRQKSAAGATLRVPAERLDKLVDLVGEMVTVQARLSQFATKMKSAELVSVAEVVERLTSELRDNAMSVRMVPIGSLFGKFRRLVRDLSSELGKEVEMVTEGEETEMDKSVIERLNDPLVHLIRNSIDHGIENPESRTAKGKPRGGILRIAASHSGAYVLIKIIDDGAGLDAQAIRTKAVQKGLIAQDADLSEPELFDLIFAPGFSTAAKVTGVSGRGVGMDVVKKNIEALKGSVKVESQKDHGTQITLKIPLTLAIIEGLLVMVGDEHFVLPLSVIEEVVALTREDMKQAHGRTTITVRGELVPYIRLRDRFRVIGRDPQVEQVIVGEVDANRLGFVVDRVIGNHQTVIKSLGPVFKSVSDISGATILGDGSVALIVDAAEISRTC